MRKNWRTVAGIAVTGVLLWWLVAKSGIDWAESWRHIRTADPFLMVLSGLVATLIFPLRARRWRTILEPSVPGIRFAPLWHATAIGMMANNVLPFRGGEFVRAFVVTREEPRVRFATAFGSLAVDRMFDAIVVLLLLAVAIPADADPRVIAGARVTGIGMVGLLVMLYVLVLYPDRVVRLFHATVSRLLPRAAERGEALLRSFAEGLGALRSATRFAAVFLWALAHWLVNALSYWIAFQAVGIEAPWMAALFVQGAIVLGAAVTPTPGFVGGFEFAAVLGLLAFGVDETLAAGWAVAYHAVSWLPITMLGLFYLARLGLGVREVVAESKDAAERQKDAVAG